MKTLAMLVNQEGNQRTQYQKADYDFGIAHVTFVSGTQVIHDLANPLGIITSFNGP